MVFLSLEQLNVQATTSTQWDAGTQQMHNWHATRAATTTLQENICTWIVEMNFISNYFAYICHLGWKLISGGGGGPLTSFKIDLLIASNVYRFRGSNCWSNRQMTMKYLSAVHRVVLCLSLNVCRTTSLESLDQIQLWSVFFCSKWLNLCIQLWRMINHQHRIWHPTMCKTWKAIEKKMQSRLWPSIHFSVVRVCVCGIEIETIIRMHSSGNQRQWERISHALCPSNEETRVRHEKNKSKKNESRLCECDAELHRRCRSYYRLEFDDGAMVCRQ